MSELSAIGFLGAGKMATALAKGFVRSGLARAEGIHASDPSSAARSHFARETGGQTSSSNADVIAAAKIIVLSVKPDQAGDVLAGVASAFSSAHLLVSICAGVPLAKLEKALGGKPRVVRVMPNTPALVGASASAFAIGTHAEPDDAPLVERLFSSVGTAFQLKESLLDAVTGLSGSGPAYGFLVIEALSDGGVAAGLPRDVATQLAAQTILGAGKMVIETGMHPGTLKDMVTSPGGTTIEGLHELEKGGLRNALINAVRAAAAKSKALGER